MKRFKLLLLAMALMSIVVLTGCKYSDGQRSGELVKFSEKGLVIKSNEGVLKLGDTKSGLWAFTVKDASTDIIRKLKESMGKKVRLSYEEHRFEFDNYGYDTNRYIVAVEVID